MADGGESITLTTIAGMDRVDAADWDRCAGPDQPFTSHAFLLALEESGSATTKAGWRPHHVVARDSRGRVVGCAPMYLKDHSYGEYVFDHGWAQAFERAGGQYYPKLQVAVPFTPVPGTRLLIAPGYDVTPIRQAMIEGLARIAEDSGVSSLHVTFCAPVEAQAFETAGWLMREGHQFHWTNRGYADFEAFLGALSHDKRKAIRRERRDVAAQGIEIVRMTGEEMGPTDWDRFFDFYISTSDRKWGSPYLTRAFFDQLGERIGARALIVFARQGGEWVGAALNLIGREALYGRNWGGRTDLRFLHFETCYYQAIDFAIARGLARVEAGAQGEHKLQRGYLPVTTHSAHWIRHAGLRRAIADFLERERRAVRASMAELAAHSPFKAPPVRP